MNFIIKYLRAQGTFGWMEDKDETLDGFHWKHTRKPVTLGVLIWPEIFKIREASGEEIIVILMDTQGVFDGDTTIKDCTSIFSLSVLLSSIQIFNSKQNVQGDDLSHLELFAEFGRLVASENSFTNQQSSHKPFQDLIFLVRDWAYPAEAPYGWDGGQVVLDEELGKDDVEGEFARMRVSIKSCFESAKCFLMPHPGGLVHTSPEFRGNVWDIKPIMADYMRRFIEDLFRPSYLKSKRVLSKELTVRDFLVLVDQYVREMHRDKLPTPKTLCDATVHAKKNAVVNSCFESYQARVSALVSDNPQTPARCEESHDIILTDILTQFNQSMKMGGEGAITAALNDLKARMANAKQHFRHANSSAYFRSKFDAKITQLLEEQQRLTHEMK